jgi:hypothetical protein
MSASSSLGYLSTVFPSDKSALYILGRWKKSGMIFIIALSAPSSWLSLSVWTFQAALLAIVWTAEDTPEKIVVTAVIGLRFACILGGDITGLGLKGYLASTFGMRDGLNYMMVVPNECKILLLSSHSTDL